MMGLIKWPFQSKYHYGKNVTASLGIGKRYILKKGISNESFIIFES
jgi:hypothetical protein